jgi:hypothetical protein
METYIIKFRTNSGTDSEKVQAFSPEGAEAKFLADWWWLDHNDIISIKVAP